MLVADPRDHGDRLRVRRLPLRAPRRALPGDRARARLRVRRQRARHGVLARCRGGAAGRLRARLLDADGGRALLPRASCRSASTSTSSPRCRRSTSGAAGPANRVPAVDVDKLMEAERRGRHAGRRARSARDLTWKEGLDAFTCTECGRCKDACPTHLTGKPLSLKGVNDSLKHHLLEQRDAIVAGDPDAKLPALVGGVIGDETLWACTTCGYCEAACPIELEHLDKFFRMRQHQVMIEGEFPHELKRVFEAYESQGNPWGLPADARGDWAHGPRRAGRAHAADMRGLDYLFYVGSAMSFDPRGQKIAARLRARSCSRAGVRFGILGAREGSTGECVAPRRQRDAVPAARERARRARSTSSASSASSPATRTRFNSLRNEYPEFGGHYEVRAPHAADRRAARRRPHRGRASLERVDLPRALLPRRGTTANTMRRARSSRGSARDAAARVRAGAREVDVLRRRRRPHVDRRDDRHAHQHRRASSRRSRRRRGRSRPPAPIAR